MYVDSLPFPDSDCRLRRCTDAKGLALALLVISFFLPYLAYVTQVTLVTTFLKSELREHRAMPTTEIGWHQKCADTRCSQGLNSLGTAPLRLLRELCWHHNLLARLSFLTSHSPVTSFLSCRYLSHATITIMPPFHSVGICETSWLSGV
jgi:hypothetical protein